MHQALPVFDELSLERLEDNLKHVNIQHSDVISQTRNMLESQIRCQRRCAKEVTETEKLK